MGEAAAWCRGSSMSGQHPRRPCRSHPVRRVRSCLRSPARCWKLGGNAATLIPLPVLIAGRVARKLVRGRSMGAVK
jgi:hypothetical protein